MDTAALLSYLNLFLPKENIRTEEPMSSHTSFRVGGPAGIFLTVPGEEELGRIFAYLHENELPYFILGNGSNLLVSDSGFDGVVVSLGEGFEGIEVSENEIKAGAAALLGRVSRVAQEAGLAGLEFASGIPGSLGGGVVMNAGAYGGELSQVICRVRAMDKQGRVFTLQRDQLELGYRTSIFKKQPYIILDVTMELKQGNAEDILLQMKEYNRLRQEKQPLEYPSAGSTFKRPEGYFAGKLIMDAGLKGYSVGGAQVSEKHCGFVINKNKATAEDIHRLMEEIQERVKQQFGVWLEPEVIFLGEKEERA